MTVTKLSEVWNEIESAALNAGALRAGASSPEILGTSRFDDWLAAGHHARMSYLEKNAEVRRDPSIRFPWARSVVVITVPYESERPSAPPGAISNHIARYALGDDYHLVLDRMLRFIEAGVQACAPGTVTRRYVDTGPLSDRGYALQAGLGWIGKNSMLIDPEHGSFIFIATLLTSLEFDLGEESVTDRCGECTRCVDSCPTEAILPDRTVDSHRCVSYLTIEHRGPMPMKEAIGENVFGCDICQEVCPWNATPADSHPAFHTRAKYRSTPVHDLLSFQQSEFSTFFSGSAVKRAKRTGMLRNAVVTSPRLTALELSMLQAEDEGVLDAVRWNQEQR